MERSFPTRLDSLTGLRFFAAWMVVVHHFANFATIPFVTRYQGFGASNTPSNSGFGAGRNDGCRGERRWQPSR